MGGTLYRTDSNGPVGSAVEVLVHLLIDSFGTPVVPQLAVSLVERRLIGVTGRNPAVLPRTKAAALVSFRTRTSTVNGARTEFLLGYRCATPVLQAELG